MKLIFAILDVSLTMGLTRCYKTEGFFTFIIISKRITADGLRVVNRASQVWFSSAQAELCFLPSPCMCYFILLLTFLCSQLWWTWI